MGVFFCGLGCVEFGEFCQKTLAIYLILFLSTYQNCIIRVRRTLLVLDLLKSTSIEFITGIHSRS